MDALHGGLVIDTLYIGGIMAIKSLSDIAQEGPVTVISLVQMSQACAFCESLLRQVHKQVPSLEIQHVIWNIKDKVDSDFLTDNLSNMLETIDANLSQGHVCLVHCAQGISRSVSVCASYLIAKRGMTFYEAMTTIRRGRPIANPNLGFVAALRALEQCKGDVIQARERLQSKK